MGGVKKEWRITISLTKEQEDAILAMRKTDRYARCSFAEIIRAIIDAGLLANEEG